MEADARVSGRCATDFERQVYCVLGLPFDALSLERVTEAVRESARRRASCFVTTPNLNYVIACRSDAELRDSVLRSDISVPDGMPLIWVARLMGVPLAERVAGSSVFDALGRRGGVPLSVYLFGGPDGAAAQACERINRSSSGLRCVGFCSPGFVAVEQMSTPEIMGGINAAKPDFLLVALPARKGQMWILANLARLAPPVVANLGAVINFVAGTIVRAPVRWQSLGIEWLWRIGQEPQLWRRYVRDGLGFIGLLLTEVLPSVVMVRSFQPSEQAIAAACVTVVPGNDVSRVTMSGAWTAANLQPLRSAFRDVTTRLCDIDIELSGVRFIDSACVGLLQLLLGHQRKTGRRLTLRAVPVRIRRRIDRLGAGHLLEP